MICTRRSILALLAAAAVAATAGFAAEAADGDDAGLAGPVRCVSDYLEALASAAPVRPVRSPRAPPPRADEPRWALARSHLAPPVAIAGVPGPPAPWEELGRDGAFLGYELLGARPAARGAAVVVVRERTVRGPEVNALFAVCAYLVAPLEEGWRIVSRRCGQDRARGFTEDEVRTLQAGRWTVPSHLAASRP